MKSEKIKARKSVIVSMIVFWVGFFTILLIHNITGTAGFHLSFSISKYVGLTFPSAITFLLMNLFVSFSLWKYLKPKLKNDTEKNIMKIIIVTLVLLSVFPIGLFDSIIPEPIFLGRTPISFLHVITSRTMFVAMAGFALYVFFTRKGTSKHELNIRKIALSFVIYAAICTFTFIFFSGIFWKYDLIFESVYILYFFLVVLAF